MLFTIQKTFLLFLVLALSTIVNGCDNMANLTIVVKYDDNPDQISVKLTEYVSENEETETEIELNKVSGSKETVTKCFAKDQLSKISVLDSGGDGFADGGYITVAINSRLIATLSDFGTEKNYFVHPDTACTESNDILPFVVDVKFDGKPEETSWSLEDKNTGNSLLSTMAAWQKSKIANGFLAMTRCISETGDYAFEIVDDDGIGSPGFYRIFSNYNLLGVGGTFTGSETKDFTISFSDRSPPVDIITQSPTMRPTPSGCRDDYSYRYISKINDNEENCAWLRDRPDNHDIDCAEPEVAFHCRYTCETCEAPCHDDDEAKFPFEQAERRECEWGRKRLLLNPEGNFQRFCNNTADDGFMKNCKHMCDLCDEE